MFIHVFSLYTITASLLSMHESKNATEFRRKIDLAHPDNIRVIIPKPIYEHLKEPESIVFRISGKNVVISVK